MTIIDASINTGKVSSRTIKLNDKNRIGKYQIIGADNFLVNRAKAQENVQTENFDSGQVVRFNGDVKVEKLSAEEKRQYNSYLSHKNNVIGNPSANIHTGRRHTRRTPTTSKLHQ